MSDETCFYFSSRFDVFRTHWRVEQLNFFIIAISIILDDYLNNFFIWNIFHFKSLVSVSKTTRRVSQIRKFGVSCIKQADKRTGLVTWMQDVFVACSHMTGVSTSLSLQDMWLNEKLRENECDSNMSRLWNPHFRDPFSRFFPAFVDLSPVRSHRASFFSHRNSPRKIRKSKWTLNLDPGRSWTFVWIFQLLLPPMRNFVVKKKNVTRGPARFALFIQFIPHYTIYLTLYNLPNPSIRKNVEKGDGGVLFDARICENVQYSQFCEAC